MIVGLFSVGLVARTTAPEPVDVVAPVPPLATGRAVPEYEIANVPEVVTGLPAIDKNAGTDAETLVTVPPPADELIVWLGHVPETVMFVPATIAGLAVPVPPLATGSAVPEYAIANVPEVVMGLPVTDKNVGTVAATEVTVPEPLEASAAIAAVVVRTVAPLWTTGTISVPVRVPEAVRFDIEVLAMSYPWSR